MGKFRKKPVVIEAIQFDSNTPHVEEFMGNSVKSLSRVTDGNTHVVALQISTLEGDMRADLGDWIIKGVKGEFYPCKPDIFAATYEAVE